ncbi:MAG TPA: hypothetical protein VGI10_07605 [Polyangiaceae bacterium]
MPRPWLLLLCVLVLVGSVYSACIGGPFVWDDYHLVVESPNVSHLQPFRSYFERSFWIDPALGAQAFGYYRPLTTLSLALDYRLHGDNSGGFHLTNLLLHLLNTSLLFQLVRRRGSAGWAAALATALWALFPRLTEAAAWISGRTDLLAASFVLLAFHAAHTGRWLGRATSGLCILLGLLCKEVALAAAFALMLDAWLADAHDSLAIRARATLPWLVALSCYAGLRIHGAGLALANSGESNSERLWSFVEAAGRYPWMLLDGFQPNAQLGTSDVRSIPFFGLGILALGASVFGVIWLVRQRRRAIVVPVLWGALSLFLTMHLLPIPLDAVAADRFLYLPLAAGTVACAPWLERWVAARPRRALAPLLLIGGYAVAAERRVEVWSDEIAFWVRFYQQHPIDNARPAIELGNVYLRGHLFADALRLFLSANEQSTWVLTARANTTSALAALGKQDDAHRIAAEVVARSPQTPSFALNLANADLLVLDFDAAKHDLQRALVLYPGYPSAKMTLDVLPELIKMHDNLPQEPTTGAEHRDRARFFAQVGRLPDSVREWQAAAESGTLSPAEWTEVTHYALQFGDSKAARWFVERAKGALGPALDPRLELAYQQRSETEAHLRRAWHEIGLGRR